MTAPSSTSSPPVPGRRVARKGGKGRESTDVSSLSNSADVPVRWDVSRFLPKRPGGTTGLLPTLKRVEFLARVIDGGERPDDLAADFGITCRQARRMVCNWRQKDGWGIDSAPPAAVAPAPKLLEVGYLAPGALKRGKRFLDLLMRLSADQRAPTVAQLAVGDGCTQDNARKALAALEAGGDIVRSKRNEAATITLCASGIVLRVGSPPPIDHGVSIVPQGVWPVEPVYEDDPQAVKPEPVLRLRAPDRTSSGVSCYGQR